MPKKTKITTAEEPQWLPTRAEMLKDNPFASLTQADATTLWAEVTARLRELQQEERYVRDVVASFNTVYMLADGSIDKAV